MAMTLTMVCRCGKGYSIYFPKAKLFGDLMGRPGDWAAEDVLEEAAGEIEAARRMALMMGDAFIDGREGYRFTCAGCGADRDVAEEVRQMIAERRAARN